MIKLICIEKNCNLMVENTVFSSESLEYGTMIYYQCINIVNFEFENFVDQYNLIFKKFQSSGIAIKIFLYYITSKTRAFPSLKKSETSLRASKNHFFKLSSPIINVYFQ